jgi:hypothetical protein
MKIKRKLRSFRCTDSLYSAMEEAANKEEMSMNEWLLAAARYQLKHGVSDEGVDVEQLEGIAKANAMSQLTAAIERTQKIFEKTGKELGIDFNSVNKKTE